MTYFNCVLASSVLELAGGQNDPPPLGTNVSETPKVFEG